MHRYREYGLVSDEDETLRRAVRDGLKRAGVPFSRFLEALAWHRDQARPGASDAQLLEAFSAYAAERGWSADERERAVGVYRAIRENGPGVPTQAPNAEEDRATVARADDLLRHDPTRYWNDIELQDAVFEARERLGGVAQAGDAAGAAGAASPAADADRRKIDETLSLLHDPSGAGQRRYWNDAALRDDYAAALARLQGEAGPAREATSQNAAGVPPGDTPAQSGGAALVES
jgi:hypothetical protein